MIIPVRYGGGTRIKIADAFSRKCPVVSTTVGAFGYEVDDGRHLLLADRPEEFSRACVDLVLNPARGTELAATAWTDFEKKWTWDAIAPKICAAAEHCIRGKAPASTGLHRTT
jgi:glycosyltransferase involved in cell wall biosynthesis